MPKPFLSALMLLITAAIRIAGRIYRGFSKSNKPGTKSGVNGKPVKIITPLINLSKAEIIKLACENNAPFI